MDYVSLHHYCNKLQKCKKNRIMVKNIKGDLLKVFKNKEVNVIVHGCNCFCNMGAGIAKSIADKFPAALNEDLKTKRGDSTKLGKYTTAHVRKLDGYIVNAYTQFRYGGGVDNFDYTKFEQFMRTINNHAWFLNKVIGFPKIGAGKAKGDWTRILKTIEENSDNLNITIYEL